MIDMEVESGYVTYEQSRKMQKNAATKMATTSAMAAYRNIWKRRISNVLIKR